MFSAFKLVNETLAEFVQTDSVRQRLAESWSVSNWTILAKWDNFLLIDFNIGLNSIIVKRSQKYSIG